MQKITLINGETGERMEVSLEDVKRVLELTKSKGKK